MSSKEPEPAAPDVMKNIAYNLPCFYKYFGRQDSYSSFGTGDSINFGEIYNYLTEDTMHEEVVLLIGKGLHEVIREAEAKARNPFIFKPALSQILKHETVIIQASVLPTIGTILH